MNKDTYDEINQLKRRLEYLMNENKGKIPSSMSREFVYWNYNSDDFSDIADKPYLPYIDESLLRMLPIATRS
jgi:hypothetical protein